MTTRPVPDTLLWRVADPSRRAVVIAILSGSLLIAASATVAIRLPFSPVPITAQTFAILLLGTTLGSRVGAATVVAYLCEGLVGLPVFAGGTSAWSPSAIPGVPVIIGPTAGYLAGFVVAAFIAGRFAEWGFDRRIFGVVLSLGVADLAIYAFGLPWLALTVGVDRVYALGMQPFVLGDVLKLAIASGSLPLAWRALRRPR